MSMHKKLQEQMRKGEMLERDRVMRILFRIAAETKKGLDKTLMTAAEKHIAELRWKIASALIAAVQIQVMSGNDPDAKTKTTDLHGRDTDSLGSPQGDSNGKSPA